MQVWTVFTYYSLSVTFGRIHAIVLELEWIVLLVWFLSLKENVGSW